jgi:sec-independent protein translocase protein TatB
VFDIGWTEMLILGVLVLLVVGPRELPTLLRTIGRYVGNFRQIAQEFRGQMADMGRDVSVQMDFDEPLDLEAISDAIEEADIGAPDLFETADAKDPTG